MIQNIRLVFQRESSGCYSEEWIGDTRQEQQRGGSCRDPGGDGKPKLCLGQALEKPPPAHKSFQGLAL